MPVPQTNENWSAAIHTVTLGATADEGGTRKSTVTIGGAKCVPFMAYEGAAGNRPVIAVEIWDSAGETWPDELKAQYGEALKDPASWAKKAVEFGGQAICLRLQGTHPDAGNHSAEQAADSVKAVLEAVDVPLIVRGCGVDEKDNEVLPKCTHAAAGENCLFGSITEKNYRTLVAACLSDKHKILAESPLDINIAKQVNILARDAGFALDDLVIFPTTGALGYGMEYVYSIMERSRLAGLSGDQLLQQPILCDVGMEAWRAKEARADDLSRLSDADLAGSAQRGPLWEALTATCLLQAGGDLICMRHPKAIEITQKAIDRTWPNA